MLAYTIRLRLGMVVALLLLAVMAAAQTLGSGTIAGVVRDSSGAVLPGVTVEVSSPALIEKVRSVVSDDQGRYQVIDLRPGTYTVVFSLGGFGTVRREGIQLTTGFTATVNADLTVGGLAETITVSGASPIVDTQNVRRAEVLSNEILEVLPTSKSMNAFRALAIGVSGANNLQDVGGNYAQNNVSLVIHNTRPGDSHWLMDGMNTQWSLGVGGGGNKLYYPNPMLSEEVVLETSGIGAESEVGGVQINAVPKDGGNTFRGAFNINYTNEHLQSSNLDDGLRARGISLEAKTKRAFNQEFGFGGPLKRDRLWFYAAEQAFRTDNYAPGNYPPCQDK